MYKENNFIYYYNTWRSHLGFICEYWKMSSGLNNNSDGKRIRIFG